MPEPTQPADLHSQLAAEILSQGGFDADLPEKLLSHERELLVARGLDAAAASELVAAALKNDETARKDAVAALRLREVGSFVSDLRRVPLMSRRNPTALRLAAARENERASELAKSMERALQPKKGRSFSRWGNPDADASASAAAKEAEAEARSRSSNSFGNFPWGFRKSERVSSPLK
jgi:hypothetical protein